MVCVCVWYVYIVYVYVYVCGGLCVCYLCDMYVYTHAVLSFHNVVLGMEVRLLGWVENPFITDKPSSLAHKRCCLLVFSGWETRPRRQELRCQE